MLEMRHMFLILALLIPVAPLAAADPIAGWTQVKAMSAEEAFQAAAADSQYVYAIGSKLIGKYDRKTRERVAVSHPSKEHLNSGFMLDGKLYCAHSNFPATPEKSEIFVVDLETMELSEFKSFGNSPHGSLTVAVFADDAWWCVFARYKDDNAKTAFVKFDSAWNELATWYFPESVVSDLGSGSISGGIWDGETFLATGHDKRVIYRLRIASEGTILTHIDTVTSPFPGQGIAADPACGGLVGINRKAKEVIFAMPIGASPPPK